MGLTNLLYLKWLGNNADAIQKPENIQELRLQKSLSIYKPGERKEERIVPNRLVHAEEKDFRNGSVLYWKRPIQKDRNVSGFNYVFSPVLITIEDGKYYATSLDEIPSYPPGYGLLYLPKGTKLDVDRSNVQDFFKLKKIRFFERLNSFGKHFIKDPYSELKLNIVERTAHELKRYIQKVA